MGSAKAAWLQRRLAQLGRALDPDAAASRRELRTMLEELRQHEHGAVERTNERVSSLEELVKEIASGTAANARQLARVRGIAAKQRELLSQFVRRSHIDARRIQSEQQVTARLARLSRSRLPIVVGPWTGEVGFELLYWIPFLHWVRETFPIDPDRLIVLSRGGVGAWYRHVTDNYDEVFRYALPREFHAATADRKKQQRVSAFDRHLVRQVMRARGIRRAHILHPSLMYTLYNAFWRYTATVKQLEGLARFRRLAPVGADVAEGLALPDNFVAVRFYFSECFPDTPANREFATRVIEGLAARTNVVLLNNDLLVDDHSDFSPPHAGRVHVLSAHMSPETNLALQTAAISRASAFVGTYGGYSYLAPLYGVHSVAFHSRTTFKQHHLELAHRVFQRLGAARLVPVDIRQTSVLADTMAGVLTAATTR
jgi:hypothetical protein